MSQWIWLISLQLPTIPKMKSWNNEEIHNIYLRKIIDGSNFKVNSVKRPPPSPAWWLWIRHCAAFSVLDKGGSGPVLLIKGVAIERDFTLE
jgi:hypothetical protein